MSDTIDLASLIRRYGDFSLAASVDQPGIAVFGDQDGAIAYREIRRGSYIQRFALGDPLADSDDWDALLRKFLAATPSVIFANVGETFAHLLATHKFYVNSLGWEALLDLAGGYDLTGPRKQNIRNARHRSTSAGFRVDEVADEDADWQEIYSVSDEWLSRKSGRRPENAFITRPLLRHGEHQRTFALRNPEGRIVHVMTLDEMWRDQDLVGYHANINRARDYAPKNSDYAILGYLVDVLREEGVPTLSLGLCPGATSTVAKARNLYTEVLWQVARQRGDDVYNFDGITRHKEEFRPTHRRPVFLAAQEPWPSSDVLGLLRVSNLL